VISIYYILLSLALIIVGPFLLIWKKARAGLSQKLGIVPDELRRFAQQLDPARRRVWFHAVSVGEFNALLPLIESFRSRHPDYQIFVSTTTATGQEQARQRCSSFAQVFYFPFDLPWITSTWLNLLRPELVAIIETEIWPGFMNECRKRDINVVLVNGRLSPRSFKGYMRWQWFFAPVLANFNAIAVQSESEKERYAALAGQRHAAAITVCGNIKLDGLKACSPAETVQIRDRLNLKADDFVIVAGSTHEGEESAFLAALKALDGRFKLILVPRHPERFDRVAQLIESSGYRARRFTRQEGFANSHDVYLLDTIGQLGKYYSLAQIAFVGGTIAPVGGHNLVEPCAHKAAVICGSHVHKTKDLFQKLNEREALLMVHDEKDLISSIRRLLESPAERIELGENGFRFLAENQGALAKTLSLLEKYLDRSESNQPRELGTAGGVGR